VSEKVIGSVPFEKMLADAERESLSRKLSGFTMQQVMNSTGWGHNKARDTIRKLMQTGKVRFIGREKVLALDGLMRPVPVYGVVRRK
jgi:hypothetical protein